MPKVVLEEVIAANRYALYVLAQDFRHRLEWDSLTERIRYEGGVVTSKTGVLSILSLMSPWQMRMEHIGVLTPSIYAANMLQGPACFSRFLVSWSFESLDENTTRVSVSIQFQTPWKLLRWVLNPCLLWCVKFGSQRALKDMKHAAENTDLLERMGFRVDREEGE